MAGENGGEDEPDARMCLCQVMRLAGMFVVPCGFLLCLGTRTDRTMLSVSSSSSVSCLFDDFFLFELLEHIRTKEGSSSEGIASSSPRSGYY